MKLLLSFLVLLFASTVPLAAQTAHSYSLVSVLQERVTLIDAASKKNDASGVTFWIVQINEVPKEKVDHTLMQFKISCPAQKIASLYLVDYDADRAVVYSSANNNTQMNPIVPDSIGESLSDFVCHGKSPYKSASVSTLDEAIAGAKRVMVTMRNKKQE